MAKNYCSAVSLVTPIVRLLLPFRQKQQKELFLYPQAKTLQQVKGFLVT